MFVFSLYVLRALQEVLALIEERLGELEREKTELTEYEELDRQRRALDYSLYEKQHAKVSGRSSPPCDASAESTRAYAKPLWT
jgi:hypothetical protein